MCAVLAKRGKRRREEPLSQWRSGLENTAVQEEQTGGWYWLAQGLVPGWDSGIGPKCMPWKARVVSTTQTFTSIAAITVPWAKGQALLLSRGKPLSIHFIKNALNPIPLKTI